MWLSSLAIGVVLLGSVTAVEARPSVCFPGLFEGGRRLHDYPFPNVSWLPLLFRQHETCSRIPKIEGELRIFVNGDSAVFGFPLRESETFVHILNQIFDRQSVPAHAFNHGYNGTDQLKDALIIRESLPYEPDIVVWLTTLDEFKHTISGWPSIERFFAANTNELIRFEADSPPSLIGPIRGWLLRLADLNPLGRAIQVRESGAYILTAIRHHARVLANWLAARPVAIVGRPPSSGRQLKYDCQATKRVFKEKFAEWETWNTLEYLDRIHKNRNVDIVVVNMPIAHEPVNDCYNLRYPAADLARYNQWLKGQSIARGLHYMDIQTLLPPEFFLDSLHPTPAGHRLIADRLSAELKPLVQAASVPKGGSHGVAVE